MWFHNWRRFFKYNDKTHFKIGIQPRHRQLHRRFAAIRRSLHSQKNARHRPQRRNERNMQNEQEYSDGQIPISPFRADTSDNDPFSSEGGGEGRSQNGTIAIRKPMTPQYHSHECRRFIFGRKRYRNLHESPKRTTTPASRDESEIEPEIKGFRLSVGHRHTAIRSTAPRDLHAAGPPRNPPYGEIPAPAAIPARPAPEQYPATSCAEKLRPDETKIPKTTTNRMKIYSFRILQIEIFYLFLSKCFP